jgi:ABC-type dipeptide/oligopeptide/nickel transport system permease component
MGVAFTLLDTGSEALGGWLLGMLGGDLGASSEVRIGASVSSLLFTAGLRSAGLVVKALALSLAVTLGLTGLAVALPRTRSLVGLVVSLVAAFPVFLLGFWLMEALNASEHVCRTQPWSCADWYPLPARPGPTREWVAAIALALGGSAVREGTSGLRETVERVLRSPHVHFSRALGLPVGGQVIRSLLGAFAGLVTTTAAQLWGMVLVAELVFQIGGLGRLTWQAALTRDIPLLGGAVLVWVTTMTLLQTALEALEPSARGERIAA